MLRRATAPHFPSSAAAVACLGAALLVIRVAAESGAAGLEFANDGDYNLREIWSLPEPGFEPLAAAVAGDHLLIADGRRRRVLVFDSGGAELPAWPPPQGGPAPTGVCGSDPDQSGPALLPAFLAVDHTRSVVHVMWHCYRGAEILPVRLLDTRDMAGNQLTVPRLVTTAGITDIAVRPATGELYAAEGLQVLRLGPDGSVRQSTTIRGIGGPVTRLAFTGDDRLLVLRSANRAAAVHDLDGSRRIELAMAGASPLDVDVAPNGRLRILQSQDGADNLGAVTEFTPQGDLAGTITPDQIGLPMPTGMNWPWTLASGPGGIVITTGDSQFRAVRLSPDWISQAALSGGLARPALLPLPDPAAAGRGVALATRPDGALEVMTEADGMLVTFAEDGQILRTAITRPQGFDLATLPNDSLVLVGRGWLARFDPADGPGLVQGWTVACDCDESSRVVATDVGIAVSDPARRVVRLHDPTSGTQTSALTAPGTTGLWPADVAAVPGQGLVTADLVRRRLQLFGPSGLEEWAAGYLAGPRRLAVAADRDAGTIVTLMADGSIEHSRLPYGVVVKRWMPRDTGQMVIRGEDVAHMARDPDNPDFGDVALVEHGRRRVLVFRPGEVATPTPSGAATATPTPDGPICQVSGYKWVHPRRIELGATAQVTLTLQTVCPERVRSEGADIVLAVDMSGSMAGAKAVAARGAARSFVEFLDVSLHRIGLVSFNEQARVVVQLTDRVDLFLAGLDSLQIVGGTNLHAAVVTADAELSTRGRPDALPVIVLLTDGRNSRNHPDPRSVAAGARDRGVLIYAIGLGSDVDADVLAEIAGDPGRYYEAPTPAELFPVYEEILRQVIANLAGDLAIWDRMGADIDYLPGSTVPRGLEELSTLRWTRPAMPTDGLTLTYEIRPRVTGVLPVNEVAVAEYNDADGARRPFVFPVPVIEVLAPTPTATATSTASATSTATATASPTATPLPSRTPTATVPPRPIYLPWLMRRGCVAGTARADVALVLDTSTSMLGDKLAAAKAAAKTFVSLLELPQDQAAVIGFNASPVLQQGLTGDRTALYHAIDALSVRLGTRIDTAVRAATIELMLSPARRGQNRPVIVLLTDGIHGGSRHEVLAEATAAKSFGIGIYTIGLGHDVDADLLAAAADPEGYFFAPLSSDLAAIYRRLAVQVGCR